MTIALNSSIVSDGLVFYYDEKNRYRGYFGKPTTNLFAAPNNITGASWTKTNATSVQIEQSTPIFIDPAGSGGGVAFIVHNLTETAVTGQHYAAQSIALTSGVTYTISVYAKAAERNEIWLATQGESISFFNLANGTFTANGNTCTMRSLGDGWYRCSASITSTATSTRLVYIGIGSGGVSSYAGTAGYGVYVQRAQLESDTEVTQFVNGARTATSTCFDIVTSTALTANTVTFGESGITFPGSIYGSIDTTFSSFGNNFTIDSWVQPEFFGNTFRLIAGRVEPYLALVTVDDKAAVALASTIDSKPTTLLSDFILNDDSLYHHVSGTSSYDTTSNMTTLTVYLDAVPIKSQRYVGSFTNTWSAYGLAVGGYYRGSPEPNTFLGKIPNLKVYNRALTQDEVAQNYLAHKGLYV